MKTRLLSTVALLSLLVLALASPAAAQKPIPSIKNTPQYRALKTYVDELRTKRNVPATPSRKSAFRSKLANKKTKANTKAKALYAQRANRISKQDDRKERRQIKQIRQNQATQVASPKTQQAARIGKLQANENAAIDRVNRSFADPINSLSNKRAKLRHQLSKTNKPAKRATLRRKIDSVQRKLNALVAERQSDVNAVVSRYNAKASSINAVFAARIQNVKAAAKRQVAQANNAWKRTFREDLAAAKERRTKDFGLISDLSRRGLVYIQEMPSG